MDVLSAVVLSKLTPALDVEGRLADEMAVVVTLGAFEPSFTVAVCVMVVAPSDVGVSNVIWFEVVVFGSVVEVVVCVMVVCCLELVVGKIVVGVVIVGGSAEV